MAKPSDPNKKLIHLNNTKANAIKKLSSIGLLPQTLENKINNAKTLVELMKFLPSNDVIKKIKKVQRFKTASGGSTRHLSTSSSLATISTPIGGQPKK
ncbi:MAG: hypothetical protein ACO1G5_00360 [Bacteroidota bacterium]